MERADKPTQSIDTTSAEQRRLRRLQREARREARRREEGIPRPSDVSDALPATGTANPSGTVARLKRRFLKATLLAAGAAMLLFTAVPPYLVPVPGATSSRFFLRTAPDSRRLFDFEHHTGLDIAAPTGTRVGASKSGRVIRTGNDPSYGLYVDVRHPLGLVTRYAHLSRIDAREGRLVFRGGRLGEVGMTGRATGPHLHFELRLGGRAFPPGPFLVFHRLRLAILGL